MATRFTPPGNTAYRPPTIRRVLFGTNQTEPHLKLGRIQITPSVADILAKPSWSVKSLLPTVDTQKSAAISRTQLHHLLKLSALPLPTSAQDEAGMLKTLESQIHFVKEVQSINTTGVEPLVAIRDETSENIQEEMITLEKLQPFLSKEIKIGTNGTIRRQKPKDMITHSGWDPFELGEGKDTRKKGKFFFVRKDRPVANR